MKAIRYIRMLSIFIILSLFLGILSGASMPESLKLNTQKEVLYAVQYEDFDLTARKITIQGSNDIAYCLEINKKYPTGQTFSLSEEINEKLNNVIAAGYPNRSLSELNLNNENEAYFATQIAIWSLISGYDVNKMKGDNPKILEAIKNIYNDGLDAKYKGMIQSKIYKTNDQSIQDVIVISYDDLVSEEKAESFQAEYPPQEG